MPTVWVDRDGSRVDALHDSRRMGGALLALWLRRRMRRGATTPASLARAEAAAATALAPDPAEAARRAGEPAGPEEVADVAA